MKFGQYELLERVAVGGMAEVYRGRVAGAEGFEKLVAIKRILPEFARDERFISMMLTEARIHSGLSHRNIVQIHDLGISEDGEYFIVLEYVEGHDLRAVMEAAAELGVQIPDSLALHVADELAQALHFAHELTDAEGQALGIVHRDVSPSNVLISNSGEVKLSDFGIARRRNDHSFVGSLKGNLVYMSPEQARRVALDRRTDVFSLGAVLFEMLTGQKVREITDEVTGFREVASGVIRSARALRPDLPDAYDSLLARALASNPQDRFQDAASFGAAIRALGRGNESPVGPADMKELLELLNPPRRARSPVERSKVIRLGPEFKALAGQGQGHGQGHGRSAKVGSAAEPTLEPSAVILAAAVPPEKSARSRLNSNGGTAPSWSDREAARERQSAQPVGPTPLPISASVPTPPPPLLPASEAARPSRSHTARFDAADTALHALEFSAGNDMEPTPPPPAVQGPYAPEVVTPVATPVAVGSRPFAQIVEHRVAPPMEVLGALQRSRTPIKTDVPGMGVSTATPPPRTSTYPGLGSGQNLSPAVPKSRQPSGPSFDVPDVSSVGSGSNRAFATTAPVFDAVGATPRRRARWSSIIVAILVVVSASLAYVHFKVIPIEVLVVWSKAAPLNIASQPSGATITLDGRPLVDETPTSVDVRRDRLDHVLEFARPGSLPGRAVVRFDKTITLTANVDLPPAPPPPPPPPLAPPVAEVVPPPAPVVAQAAAPPPTPGEKRSARRAARLSGKNSAKKGEGRQLESAKHFSKKHSSKKGGKSKKAGGDLGIGDL